MSNAKRSEVLNIYNLGGHSIHDLVDSDTDRSENIRGSVMWMVV